jgi:hypothetical protein
MSEPFATVDDIETLKRPLDTEEASRATALLPIVSDTLRQYASMTGVNLDEAILTGKLYGSVVKSVTVDIVIRELNSSTSEEPLSQFSQGAGGYTVSGTYLSAGGGIFVKRDELTRLGIRRQRLAMVDADLGILDVKAARE